MATPSDQTDVAVADIPPVAVNRASLADDDNDELLKGPGAVVASNSDNYVRPPFTPSLKLGDASICEADAPIASSDDIDSFLGKTASSTSPPVASSLDIDNFLVEKNPKQDPLDFTNKYNTPLSTDEEKAFDVWKSKYAPNDSGYDYDLRGAFKAGVVPDSERGHFPDTFKKPNHPTFSDQSQYNGYPDGQGGTYQGGTWGKGDSFLAGATNLAMHGADDLKAYFKKYEPASQLGFPTQESDIQFGDMPVTSDQVNDFLKMQDRPLQKRVAGVPMPVSQQTMSGMLGGTHNAFNSEGRTILGAVGSGVQWAGSLLSQLDPTVDQADDTTNPYIQPGLDIRSGANLYYPEDPDRPISSTVGSIAGSVLPVAVTGGAAAIPEGGSLTLGLGAKAIGSGMFGSQMYTDAADKGAAPLESNLAGATGIALGGFMPSTNLFHASPAIASATWGQLGKNLAYGTLLNSSKAYWEMAGMNQISGEVSNAVLPQDQQQTQSQVAYNSLSQALPMAFVGAAAHGIGQANAEVKVGKTAAGDYGQEGGSIGPAQDKASFIVNTTQAMDGIANDASKTPQMKMKAIAGFMAAFSPQAQQIIAAHVQNVSQTIKSIQTAASQAANLAQTNPVTAPALEKEQKDAAIATMTQNAAAIENDADEAEKNAISAIPHTDLTTSQPVSASPVDSGKVPLETEPPPVVPVNNPEAKSDDSPIHGGMESNEYDALANKMENSPDPDIQTRARQLLDLRQQALAAHASTESPSEKAALEQEILEHESALRDLSTEPEAVPEPDVETPKIQTATDEQLEENLENATVNANDPDTPESEKPFWNGAIDAINAEKERRAATKVPDQPHVLAFDEYGKPLHIPVNMPEATPEIKTNVQEKNEPAPIQPATDTRTTETGKETSVEPSVPAKQESTTTVEGAAPVAEANKPEEPKSELTNTPLKDLSRDDLVKVAKAEGHDAGDIKNAKTPKALRELIETKRALKQEGEPKMVSDGKAEVDSRSAKLPDKYRKAVEGFIATARRTGLGGVTKFVLQSDGGPVETNPRAGIFDTVYINPIALARDIDYAKSDKGGKASNADIRYLHDKIFDEEFTHLYAAKMLHGEWTKAGSHGLFSDYYQKRMATVYDEMTAKQRKDLQKSYGGDLEGVDITKQSSDHGDGNVGASRMGEEFFRQVIQRRSGKGIAEDSIAKIRANKPLRRILQSVVDKFNAILEKMSARGQSSPQLESMVNDYQKALDESSTASKKSSKTKVASIQRIDPMAIKTPSKNLTPDVNETNERNADDSRNDQDRARNVQAAIKGSPGAVASILRSGEGKGTEGDSQQGQSDAEPAGDKTRLAAYKDFVRQSGKALPWSAVPESSFIARGGEHSAFKIDDRVYKSTFPDEFGTGIGMDYDVSPYDYFHRLDLSNKIFGDDVKFEGAIFRNGKAETITSQRYLNGELPTGPEAGKYMEDKGFRKVLGTDYWYRKADNILVTDANARNFIKTKDGQVHAIDLIPQESTPELEEKLGLVVRTPAAQIAPAHDFDDTDVWDAEPTVKPEDAKAKLQDSIGYPEKTDPNSLQPLADKPLEGVASGPNEKLRSARGLGEERGNNREQEIARRIESLKHVDIPQDKITDFKNMAAQLSRAHFGQDRGNRDIAEGNALVKVLIEAKKWVESGRDLSGFGARRIIQNSLMDDGRRFARSERMNVFNEVPDIAPKEDEDAGGSERSPAPKGYDPSDTDYEAQQSQFEPTGSQGEEIATNENAAKLAQNKEAAANVKAVTDRISPYGRRLLEIKSDTPNDPHAAFEPWVTKAAKEFGVTKAKIMQDMDAITQHVASEVSARGLTPDDFRRAPAKSIAPEEKETKPEAFAARMAVDPRVGGDLSDLMASRTYEMTANKVSHQKALDFFNSQGLTVSYKHITDKLLNGNPDEYDSMLAQIVIAKLRASVVPTENAMAAELSTMYSTALTRNGKFIQAARAWAQLGSDGILAEYDKIIRPVIETARKPFKALTDAIEGTIKTGKAEAIAQTVDRLQKNGLFEKYETADEWRQRLNDEAAMALEKPAWQRYMESTAAALSKLAGDTPRPLVKGALEEFASRMQQNLKSLMEEGVDKSKNPAKPKPMSAESKLSEIYKNEPEYREAWEYAKTYIDAKYAEAPDVLALFHDSLKQAFEAPAKLTNTVTDNAIKAKGIKVSDLVKEWSGTQNATRDSLIKSIQDKMPGLTPEQSKALGDAVFTRFQERLQTSKKTAIQNLLRKSGNNRLTNKSSDIAKEIFKAINLGALDSDATWNALAGKLGLPKYDKAVAEDLAKRANEIQKMVNERGESFVTDGKTQDMMNVLADQAQKHMHWLRQIGNGELAVFYGNIFGPSTIGRKSISEVLNLVSEVGTMGLAEMRRGDLLAVPRAYGAAMRGLYQRGGLDFRSILTTGRGFRQGSQDYSAPDNLTERGKIFGNVPILSKLNKPLSMVYKPIGRALYGAQAFFYAGAAEARSNMIAYRLAKQDIAEGKIPKETSINDRASEILGNSPDMRDKFQSQAVAEGLTGRMAAMRAQELAEMQRPQEMQDAAHDFASRATFMQEPDGVLGALYKRVSSFQQEHPWSRLLVPVTRVVSNVFNNFLAYTPVSGGLRAMKYAREGKSDEAYQQLAKVTLGALGTIGMATMFGSNIQGAGPKDYNKKKQLMDQGWIPYSVKVGNKYYSYREWPTALMMAGLGNYFDSGKYNETGHADLTSRLALATIATGQFALTSSWISSVNDLLNTFDPQNPASFEQHWKNLVGTTTGSLVPFNQKTLQVIDKIFDPDKYPPENVTAALASQVAFVRRFDNGNQPALNALGDPIQSNPIQAFYSSANVDPVWGGLAKQGLFIPTPTKSERVNGRPITNDEFYTLVKEAGQATKEQLEGGELDNLASMDKGEAQTYLDAIYRANLMRAKMEIESQALDAGYVKPSRQHHK